MRVVVASRNRHKLREIAVLLADAGLAWDLVSVDEIAPKCALAEDEPSFEGNALSKARQAAAATGLPALADDSGIEVDALGGAPGVYSARWSGEPSRVGSGRALLAADHRGRALEPSQGSHVSDDARNNQKMLRELTGVPTEKRTARYRCAAAFVDPGRGLELVRMGACEGRLLESPQGTGGFGYDPLFFIESLGRTMAEIPLEEKNRLSHRAAAFRQLARVLAEFHLVG
ncbi:MAG: RdgB/HAM1 family non-canonical purine NTP pyrophosphatase [Polyangia bacterium]